MSDKTKTHSNQQAKGHEPHDKEDEVGGKGEKVVHERRHEQDRVQGADARQGQGVDDAGIVGAAGPDDEIDEAGGEAEDDGRADELPHPEDDGAYFGRAAHGGGYVCV